MQTPLLGFLVLVGGGGEVAGHIINTCIGNLKLYNKGFFSSICFIFCRHKTQAEEDIAICECKYDENDPESACGERCLNVITSTECTPGHCPCGVYCKNQVNFYFFLCVCLLSLLLLMGL